MDEHSDEGTSKQCAPNLPCHYGYMAIGTGNEICKTRRQTNDAHSEVSYGYEEAKEQVRGEPDPIKQPC